VGERPKNVGLRRCFGDIRSSLAGGPRDGDADISGVEAKPRWLNTSIAQPHQRRQTSFSMAADLPVRPRARAIAPWQPRRRRRDWACVDASALDAGYLCATGPEGGRHRAWLAGLGRGARPAWGLKTLVWSLTDDIASSAGDDIVGGAREPQKPGRSEAQQKPQEGSREAGYGETAAISARR